MAKEYLTAQRLRDVLLYDPETGVFRWALSRGSRAAAGAVAGWLDDKGYVRIQVDGHTCFAHRLAWLHCYGEWPDAHIDHRDGDPSNNRIDNLRAATRSQNMTNQRRAQANNKLGLLGVIRDKRKFRAQIRVNGRLRSLGSFATPEQAHEAYLAAKAHLHPFQTLVKT